MIISLGMALLLESVAYAGKLDRERHDCLFPGAEAC